MNSKNYVCPFCANEIDISYPNSIHAGFNDSGFMYCDNSSHLVTWSILDKYYKALVNGAVPWLLSAEEKNKIETAVINCECGGSFKFSAKPRCPHCSNEIPEILPDAIHYIKLGKVLDGETENIWKE